MTVAELKTALALLPDDMPIGLCVYRHLHIGTEGTRVTATRMHFSGGVTRDFAVIHEGGLPTESNGHRPTPIQSV